MALSSVEIFSEHFLKDHMKILKLYHSPNRNEKQVREELIFHFHSYIRQMKHNYGTYKEQVKRAEKVLEVVR